MTQAGRAVDTTLAGWQGDAATAAGLRRLEYELSANHISAAVIDAADALADAATLTTLCTNILTIETEAKAKGCVVNDDGSVSAARANTGNPALDVVFQATLDNDAAGFQNRIKPLLETAGTTDEKAGAKLAAAIASLTGLAQNPQGTPASSKVTDIINGNAFLPDDPKAMYEFWESLSPSDKDLLAAYDPNVGNRDGIPAVEKDHYNRLNLTNLQTSAQSNLDALNAQHPDWAEGKNLPTKPSELAQYERWNESRDTQQGLLNGYKAVETQVSQTSPPRYLLSVDDAGHGAIALNNPDSASNVATYVPGTFAKLEDIDEGIERSDRTLASANSASPGAANSVITWYGYDAPQSLFPEAAQDRFADKAAPALDRFQDGLRATHDGPASNNTLVGHSYGSTVIGHAASGENSLAVDNVVFVGSPGVDVNYATDLHLDGVPADQNKAHIFASAASADPVPAVGGVSHGLPPSDGAFGATVFESSHGSPIDVPGFRDFPWSSEAHSSYWDRGNPGLVTQGKIITGTYR
ncbi:alpha/beta hydrolase [Nocardia sp. IBHARD005]|uniref:alpha/beta hydrolase n=1 Tax=Nocardia sp. IBHARD005 TaxID=3457765 RepID=UPI00405941B4